MDYFFGVFRNHIVDKLNCKLILTNWLCANSGRYYISNRRVLVSPTEVSHLSSILYVLCSCKRNSFLFPPIYRYNFLIVIYFWVFDHFPAYPLGIISLSINFGCLVQFQLDSSLESLHKGLVWIPVIVCMCLGVRPNALDTDKPKRGEQYLHTPELIRSQCEWICCFYQLLIYRIYSIRIFFLSHFRYLFIGILIYVGVLCSVCTCTCIVSYVDCIGRELSNFSILKINCIHVMLPGFRWSLDYSAGRQFLLRKHLHVYTPCDGVRTHKSMFDTND